MNTDFTQGSILKKLSAFMLPVLGTLVLQAAYGAVDLLVVGRFGSIAGLSAVSTGSQMLNLVTFVVTQLAMGVTVLIAHFLGEKKPTGSVPPSSLRCSPWASGPLWWDWPGRWPFCCRRRRRPSALPPRFPRRSALC